MTSVSGHLRQQAILEQLRACRYVRTAELMAQLQVSYPTVARDLAALERLSLVRRVRGGAVATTAAPVSATRYDQPPAARHPHESGGTST